MRKPPAGLPARAVRTGGFRSWTPIYGYPAKGERSRAPSLWPARGDWNGTVRATSGRITTAGVVTNYADPSISSPEGITAGPDGALWFTNFSNSSIGRITTDVTPQIAGVTPSPGRWQPQ
jgi:hypothetical protein